MTAPGFAYAGSGRAIAICLDDAYLEGALALLGSISVHCPRATVVLLRDTLSEVATRALTRSGASLGLDVHVRRAAPVPDGLPQYAYISQAAYLRLQIAALCSDFALVLYLDADTLVVAPIDELLSAELDGAPFGATADWFLTIGAPVTDRQPISNGVLLIDPASWVERRMTDRIVDRLLHAPRAEYPDQQAFNDAVEPGEWVELDPKWNFAPLPPHLRMIGFRRTYRQHRAVVDERMRGYATAAVVHFFGPVKPWHAGFPAGAERDLFRANLELARAATADELSGSESWTTTASPG